MASLKDLVVTGPARIVGKVFSTGGFSGPGSELTSLNGSNISSGTVPYARLPVGTGASQVAQGSHTHNYAGSSSAGGAANSATKATQDESGNNIKASYAASISISDHTITLKNKNGTSLGTVTVPDNNTTYSFTDANPTLAWGTKSKVATVGGVDIHVTMPANPDTNTWRGIQDNLTSSTNTTESLSAKQGYLLANGSARDDTKLPLTGGTLTGAVSGTELTLSDNLILGENTTDKEIKIKYQTSLATYDMIKFLPGINADGHGILIGGGGTVIIGAGESANNLRTALNISPGTEHTYITADGNIEFYPNCNTIGDRNKMIFKSNGDTVICGRLYRISTTMADSKATVSSNTAITGVYDQDGNGVQVGYSEIFRTPTPGVYRSFAVSNTKANITSAIYLNAFDNGDRFIASNIPNHVLWSGTLYMTAGHTANLSANISDQLNGITLCWSAYVNSAAQNYDWIYTFIPKHHVAKHGSTGVGTVLATTDFGAVGTKYVYVHNDKIVGNDTNDDTGTKNGITYKNNYWVLRYVVGV